MSQRTLLFFGAILGLGAESISTLSQVNQVSVILSSLFILLFVQEAWVIQWKMRKENVDFTRRFNRKYPPGEFPLVRNSPSIIGAIGVGMFMIFIGFSLELTIIHGMVCIFFILKWLTDPLLGCISDYHERLLQPMFAYVVIYIYAATSSLDSSILLMTPLPWTQSISLVMFFLAVLQMRMAYYQKFCFKSEVSVERQLNFVLFSLLFLSFPRLAYAIELLANGMR